MLLAIRERVMGVVGWIILVFLFIAFAFFGLNSYLQSTAVDYAAKVNDEEIPQARVKLVYDQLAARMRSALGDRYSATFSDETLLRKAALERVINDVLVMQSARDLGFTASDRLVASNISGVEEFKKDGVFSKDRYRQILSYQGMTPSQFEYRLKEDLASEQFRNGIRQTAAVTQQELRDYFALQRQLRKFSYLLIPADHVAGQVQVSDTEIESYYREHPDQFSTPEQVRLQYVELDSGKLGIDEDIPEEQLQALYEEQKASFVEPEQRHARHILVALNEAGDAGLEKAESRVTEIEKRLDSGESFEALAKEFSDDPGSRDAGGDLGFFGREVMTPEFETAVFSMQPGERSAPVRTPFGLHIIELLEIRPEIVTPYEAVRAKLHDELLQEQRSQQFFDMKERLATLAFEQPDSLQGVADELGLQVQETDWVSGQDGAGIADNPDVREAAFSEDVLGAHNNSEPISIDEEHEVVIRVLDHQAASVQPFEQVKDQVAGVVRELAVQDLLQQKGTELVTELESGTSTMQEVAERESLEVSETGMLQRNAQQPARELVERVFSMPRPAGDKPQYSGSPTADGSYAILALQDVLDGSLDNLPESARMQARRSLVQVQGAGELMMVLDDIRSSATINIPEQASQ